MIPDPDTVETICYKDHTIEIIQDSDPISPRERDNLGTMICFHNEYILGDNHNFRDPDSFIECMDETKQNLIILPIYAYEHSGITIKTGRYTCPWDSGQVGWIYVTHKKVKKEYNWIRLTQKRIELIKTYLNNEIETYDQYLTGNMYGYSITGPLTNDSCWSFFGTEDPINEAKNVINCTRKNLQDNPQLNFTVSQPKEKEAYTYVQHFRHTEQ